MHRKYSKDGLVCMSVSVNDADDKDKALEFLKKQNAEFGNYLIDEKGEVWSRLLNVSGPPAALIFDRAGQRVKTFTTEESFTYADIEKFITPLLKQSR